MDNLKPLIFKHIVLKVIQWLLEIVWWQLKELIEIVLIENSLYFNKHLYLCINKLKKYWKTTIFEIISIYSIIIYFISKEVVLLYIEDITSLFSSIELNTNYGNNVYKVFALIYIQHYLDLKLTKQVRHLKESNK
jgi:hypothetical protein